MSHENNSYRASLRRIRRELRYECRDELIGAEIVVTNTNSVAADVSRVLQRSIPNIGELIEGSFQDKYTFLDLTFLLDPQPTESLRAKLRILQEFGYLPMTKDEGLEALPAGADPMNNGALFLLEEDLDLSRVVLRLYLEPTESARRIHGNSRLTPREQQLEAQKVLPVKERKFPIRFRVVDAALTNAESIWLFKHFYL